jgi:NifB/MoaA-like Fe-S oxidoreductase
MLRSFESEWDAAMGERAAVKAERRKLSLATGESAYGFILRLIEKANAAGFGINCAAYKIINDFFGESITVSGLITGRDIISRLKCERLGEALLLSSSMIKKDTDLFLDGVTVRDAEKALGVKIKLIQGDGAALFRVLTKPKRRV